MTALKLVFLLLVFAHDGTVVQRYQPALEKDVAALALQ